MTEQFPENIERLIAGKEYTVDSIGRSDGAVYIFDDMVLKSEKCTDNAISTVEMMKWLSGRLPVPEVLAHEVEDGKSYLLMSRIKGRMALDRYFLEERPDELISLLAEGLKMLWSIDISDCPRMCDLDTELIRARERVEKGLVNTDDAEPDTFGKDGFKDPAELLEWLENNRPESDLVLSHGDLCLPNIFIENGSISGFIDLGSCGIADRWEDIALCWRSLRHNSDGTYGNVYEGIHPDMLFEKLGIEPNHEKLRYYILLDELF